MNTAVHWYISGVHHAVNVKSPDNKHTHLVKHWPVWQCTGQDQVIITSATEFTSEMQLKIQWCA